MPTYTGIAQSIARQAWEQTFAGPGQPPAEDLNYGPFTDPSGFLDRITIVGEAPTAIEDLVIEAGRRLATTGTVNGLARQKIPGLGALEAEIGMNYRPIRDARSQLVIDGRLEQIGTKFYLPLQG